MRIVNTEMRCILFIRLHFKYFYAKNKSHMYKFNDYNHHGQIYESNVK